MRRNIVLHWLEYAFGMTATALPWIQSCLSDVNQTVVVNALKSEPSQRDTVLTDISTQRDAVNTVVSCEDVI